MGTCKDCKWWGLSDDLYGYRDCRLIPSSDDRSDSDLAYVSDPTGSMGGLQTRPDFGCNQFAAKGEGT